MPFHTDKAGRVGIIFFSEYQKLLRNPPLQGHGSIIIPKNKNLCFSEDDQ
jgi:hypothetical protein